MARMPRGQGWVAPPPASQHKDQVTLTPGFDEQVVKGCLCHNHSPEPRAVSAVQS